MPPRPQTFIEYDILHQDAARDCHYRSFEDFWTIRLAPMQFIPSDAKGALGALLAINKERAREQWILWLSSRQNPDGIASLPQAGELLSSLPQAEPLP